MKSVWASLLIVGVGTEVRAQHWPAFRGGELAGVAEAPTLPSVWGERKNVRWKTAIPGGGWSSPVVWGNRVFLTTAISGEKQPEPRPGLYIRDLQGKPPPGVHRWCVLCLDASTGKLLWQKTAFEGKASGPVHLKNSLASETPVTDGQRVYAYFGNLGVVCYDHDGKELWKKTTPVHKMRMGWGTAASPALAGDRLILIHDNEEKSFLGALDAKTGKALWRVERDEKSNWVTPFIWKHKARTEVVTAGSGAIRSYDLAGKELWSLKGMSIIAIPTPFARHGLLHVTSGYVADPFRRPLYAIRPGAAGEISGEAVNKFVAWSQRYGGPYHPSPLVYGDYLYVLLDRGFLACYEARTGKQVYGNRRLGPTAYTASPWAYDGKVFCLSEGGETVVVKAGKEFEVLGRNWLDGMSLATPALAGGSLFVRTQTHLYCLRKR